MSHKYLETLITPFLLIDQNILEKNIRTMSERALKFQVSLRPHVKTHKSPRIAGLQIKNGAIGVTVANIREAETMLQNGIKNIFIARSVTGGGTVVRLEQLMSEGKISIGVDSVFHLELLKKLAIKLKKPVNIRIEIDSGQERCGLKPFAEELSPLLSFIEQEKNSFLLEGFFTHAGHVYSHTDRESILEIANAEARALIDANAFLAERKLSSQVLSVGTTPTAGFKVNNEINEIRPGNYVFNDAIQIANGSAKFSECALRVVTRVIGVYENRCIIDAGSKALGLDKGAHGASSVKGFGIIENYPELSIARLSEEHGIIDFGSKNPEILPGQLLQIVPNHACACANLFSEYQVLTPSGEFEIWPISGRL